MEVLGDYAMSTHVFSNESQSILIKRKSEFDALWKKYTTPCEPVSIESRLGDKIIDLLNALNNDTEWQDLQHVTNTLTLPEEDIAKIIQCLTKAGHIMIDGNRIKANENSSREIALDWDEELQKRTEVFTAEHNYFIRNGNLKPGGIFEKMYLEGQLAIDGKKIKLWSFPIPSDLLPRTLIEKLYRLSSTYYLFKRLEDRKVSWLYEAWNSKKAKY